jgi:dTDP-4-amino-4,6-dideoxygalactose transaminase/nucleoside-diphosphate-sugar epimerase
MNTKQTILITGGSGFIGFPLIVKLLEKHYHIISIDNRVQPEAASNYDLKRWRHVQGDITDAVLMNDLIEKVDLVIHMAAIVKIENYIQNPDTVLDVNIIGTRIILRACLKYNVPIIVSSSSEIYGTNSQILHETAHRIYGPSQNFRWCYAISKSAVEQYTYAYIKKGLRATIIRYFNIYGPRLDKPGEGRVISQFLGNLINQEPLCLVNGGKAVRSFCYIDDAIEFTCRLVSLFTETQKVDKKAFNIGNPKMVTSIKDLGELMIKLSGHQQGYKKIDGGTFWGKGFEEIDQRLCDTTKIEKYTHYQAQVTLTEGLTKVLQYWNLYDPKASVIENDIELIPWINAKVPRSHLLNDAFRICFESGQLTNRGTHLINFENRLKNFLNIDDIAVVDNGSDALLLSIQALDLRGKVILPAYTFMATLNAVLQNNLIPVFCDIDPERWTIDPVHLKTILEQENGISAIIPVNVFGNPPDLAAISSIAKEYQIPIVYDNAHGFGTRTDNQYIPHEPLVQTFSFHATKVLSAIEGGAVVSKDARLLDEIRRLQNHGISHDVLRSSKGYNAKMDELRALVGTHSLRNLTASLSNRRRYAKEIMHFIHTHYPRRCCLQRHEAAVLSNFQNLGCIFQLSGSENIDMVKEAFLKEGVETRRYFHPPLHRLEIFKDAYRLPNTERVWKYLLCLPIYNEMRENQLNQIKKAISNVVKKFC